MSVLFNTTLRREVLAYSFTHPGEDGGFLNLILKDKVVILKGAVNAR
jgi:hypothetical protein